MKTYYTINDTSYKIEKAWIYAKNKMSNGEVDISFRHEDGYCTIPLRSHVINSNYFTSKHIAEQVRRQHIHTKMKYHMDELSKLLKLEE